MAEYLRFPPQIRYGQGRHELCRNEMSIDWNDLRLFLDVARLGGLSAATQTTKLSAATLGRRITALEKQVGEPLFHRAQSGYTLTRAGDELLRRAEEVELRDACPAALARRRDRRPRGADLGRHLDRRTSCPSTSMNSGTCPIPSGSNS